MKRHDTTSDEWDDPFVHPDGSPAWLGIIAWSIAIAACAAGWVAVIKWIAS